MKIGFQDFKVGHLKPFKLDGEFDPEHVSGDEFEIAQIRITLEPGNTLFDYLSNQILREQHDEILEDSIDTALDDQRRYRNNC